jgi:phosphoribosylformylglycinamidine (FGAM) synthase-like enzyme
VAINIRQALEYGNKFGEPLIAGYCRSFGQRLKNGERREWIKPIMFSAGFGRGVIENKHSTYVGSPPPPLRVCNSTHRYGESSSYIDSNACSR